MAAELSGQWVGPMPVAQFLATFLPTDKDVEFDDTPLGSKEYFNQLEECEIETDMYEPFVKLANSLDFMDEFKFVNTSRYADPAASKGMKNKPDIGVYKTNVDTDKIPTQYSSLEVIWEFKRSNDLVDPFEDPPENLTNEQLAYFSFEPTAQLRVKTRGQLGLYIRNWFARQHRTHGFIVWIGDPYARIIRMDRDGGIVSKKFNFRTTSYLVRFIYRICRADDRARGIDTTVEVVTDKNQIAFVQEKLEQWKPEAPDSYPIYQLGLPNGTSTRKVFVWAPMSEPYSLTGRGTRGYAAWDPVLKKVIFVKDSWRPLAPGMEKETDILQTLNKNEVRNVPKLVCGDDLDGHFTITKDYASKSWNVGGREENLSRRAHIRFGEDFVGIRLHRFSSSKEFLQAVFDAFIAHKDAYEKCRILHRDISGGNVLLNPNGGGILNDWDLARTVTDIENGPRQPTRSGTWQYMSAHLCMNSSKISTLQDDLESFFWLVLYFVLRYMDHNIPQEELPDLMDDIFDSYRNRRGQAFGGQAKLAIIQSVSLTLLAYFEVNQNSPMTTFVERVRRKFDRWYRHCSEIELQARTLRYEEQIEDAGEVVPVSAGSLSLNDHAKMEADFKNALSMITWPSDDKSIDRLAAPKRRLVDVAGSQQSGSKRSRTSNDSSLVGSGSSGVYSTSSLPSGSQRPRGSGRLSKRGLLKPVQKSGSHNRRP
ncbi:hypothetical protein CPB84DRAFT_792004 [Gymnopilus junonius]|uniref:Protein kinase domain-containing protein n=1 Tax=Gymnopilus junonius TaxID=109634 RepID=A0A9P5N790_GYMJU|nr:hypothetical protein CPB84DRAFT_792004 [Gymnopilus junonius]